MDEQIDNQCTTDGLKFVASLRTLTHMSNEPASTAEVARVRSLFASGDARRLRESASLSLEDVARAVGVNRSSIYRWESGETRPSRDEAIRAGALFAALKRVGAK